MPWRPLSAAFARSSPWPRRDDPVGQRSGDDAAEIARRMELARTEISAADRIDEAERGETDVRR